MIKGIEHIADRTLHNICIEKSNDIMLRKTPGSASTQMEIRRIADRILEYARDPSTAFGIIEVVFPEEPWKKLKDLYTQCPVGVTFKNFIPEQDEIDQNTVLVKHLIVVTNWSNAFKVFKATIENERIHLMLYSAVKKPKI